MSYKLKIIKNKFKNKSNIIRQYAKALNYYSSQKNSNFFVSAQSLLKAHLIYGISPLLYSYYRLETVGESEWGEYVVDQDRFNELITGDSPIEARREVGNKLRFYQHCINNNLPIVPIFFVFSAEPGSVSDGIKIVNDLNGLRGVLSRIPGNFFIKPSLGASGIGSFAVYRENDIFHFSGQSGTVDDLFSFLSKKCNNGRDLIVQPRVITHSSLSGIVSNNGLSTIRVATVISNGKSKVIMACLKLVRGENEQDNFSKGMSNNLIVPIDISTGKLNKAWGSLRTDWPQMVEYAIHPDTGNQIEGISLPFWKDIFAVANLAQESLPLLQTIGWDIALTDDGIFIVEANTAYDAASFQLFEGRGLKSEFEKLFKS